MDNNNVQFVDAESYSGKADEKISFRMIVLEHFRRICSLASKEFRGGYWEKRPYQVTAGYIENFRIYVPDTREEYSNAVDCLFDILYPHFDEQMKEDYKKFEIWAEKKEEEIEEYYSDEEGKERYKGATNHFKTDLIKKIKRKLFRHLSSFLKRNGYLEGKSFEEEI